LERLTDLAKGLAGLNVDVIVAGNNASIFVLGIRAGCAYANAPLPLGFVRPLAPLRLPR
jgi:hypothetical protein